jgi:hypothetical protein
MAKMTDKEVVKECVIDWQSKPSYICLVDNDGKVLYELLYDHLSFGIADVLGWAKSNGWEIKKTYSLYILKETLTEKAKGAHRALDMLHNVFSRGLWGGKSWQ